MLKHGHNQVNKPTEQAMPSLHMCPIHCAVSLTVIINAKPCACLMALLTKIMRCILQVRAQEQPVNLT